LALENLKERMTRRTPKKYQRSDFFDGKKADDNIKYCKKCNRCWEITRQNNKKNMLLHYDNFPTYKRQREICSFCIKKTKGAHVS
tara:strand:+ start:3427 stop:3681 length:255 start_codon:yes stop_codon:yes gene_type:complete